MQLERASSNGLEMDTLEFLRLILPEYGNHYIALFKEGNKFPAHLPVLNLEDMADKIAEISRRANYQVYHACASYKMPFVEIDQPDGTTKKKYRVPENWDRARAFWLDIDCGEEKAAKGDGYPTQKDAAKAVFKFADTIGWPRPMLVSSGYGVHAYWPLTKDIKSETWVKIATALKSTLAHEGVLADPTRTADFASILRPVGAANRKNGGEKSVRVLAPCEPFDPAELAASLSAYVKANGVKMVKEKTHKPRSALMAEAMSGLDYPQVDNSIDLIASKCEQVAQMKRTLGDVGYEVWRGINGLAKHCVDGEAMMEAWNERRLDNHDQDDWRVRYDTWSMGPTTCEFFEASNCDGCTGCEHKGNIKSPIVLGRIIPITVEKEVEVTNEDAPQAAPVAVTIPALPTGYMWDGQLMSRLIPDKDGVLHPMAFSTELFYLTSRIRGEDGTYRHGVRMHMNNNRIREFEITGEALASNADLMRAMAKHELHVSNHKDAANHMAAYLRDQLRALKSQVDEVRTLSAYGWKGKDFLLGNTLYCNDGTEREVLLGANAKSMLASLSPSGTAKLSEYAAGIDYLYNRKDAVHMQYTLLAGWSSILTPMADSLYKGMVFALHGGKTGRGKTTVCHASLYAFGRPDKLAIGGKDGYTNNGLWGVVGTLNNIPAMVDELSNVDPRDMSALSYGVSNGREKVRMQTRNGQVQFANSGEWGMNVFVTGNNDFHGVLASGQANSQAEAVRLIQIEVDSFPSLTPESERDKESPAAAEEMRLARIATNKVEDNCCLAGIEMVRYVTKNYDAVKADVDATLQDLSTKIPGTEYRFYRNHTACTLAIGRVAKKLGIIDFDLVAMEQFIIDLLHGLTSRVMQTNSISDDDMLGQLVNSLMSRILVTNEMRDKRDGRGPETPRNRIIGEVAGRYVLGTQKDKTHAGHLMLAQKEVRDWCIKNRTDYNALMAYLTKEGVLLNKSEKVTLTKGTDFPYMQHRCIVIDLSKAEHSVAPTLTLVGVVDDQEEQSA